MTPPPPEPSPPAPSDGVPEASTPGRTAVIGDIGGHVEDLRLELARLGADPVTGRLPPDLTVIQVGDLIHRGPDSAGVVELVDGYLLDQPGQWVQLVGNHEAQYLRDRAFDWPERLTGSTVDTLRRWWADGRMRVAASVLLPAAGTGAAEEVLVTHAGLTRGFWTEILDRLVGAARVAAALNSLIGSHEDVLFHAGHMLARRRADLMAGPVWAAAGTELLPSWLGTSLPFSQVHGHTSVFDWQRQRYRAGDVLVRATTVDEQAKHETTVFGGGRIVGVDPGHGERARRPWRAWVVPSAPPVSHPG